MEFMEEMTHQVPTDSMEITVIKNYHWISAVIRKPRHKNKILFSVGRLEAPDESHKAVITSGY